MNKSKSKESKVIVPLYKQSTYYSCGAACAIMALSYFKKIRPSRKLEFLIWKDSLHLPWIPASDIGLVSAIANRGLKAKLIRKGNRTANSFWRASKSDRTRISEIYNFFEKILIENRSKNLSIVNKMPSERDVIDALDRGTLVIPSVDIYYFDKASKTKAEHIPHWVVITGYDKNYFYVNDPDNGKLKLPRNDLGKAMNTEKRFGLPQAMIIVGN